MLNECFGGTYTYTQLHSPNEQSGPRNPKSQKQLIMRIFNKINQQEIHAKHTRLLTLWFYWRPMDCDIHDWLHLQVASECNTHHDHYIHWDNWIVRKLFLHSQGNMCILRAPYRIFLCWSILSRDGRHSPGQPLLISMQGLCVCICVYNMYYNRYPIIENE